jgi:uncharacterized protein
MSLSTELPRVADTTLASNSIVDCDVHPAFRSAADIKAYLPSRWREHMDRFGMRQRQPFATDHAYPRVSPGLARRDAFPPGGGAPGSDLRFMQEQLLDGCGITHAILQPLSPNGMEQPNQDFGAEICRAVNRWSVEAWTSRDPRLRSSIVVPQEDPETALAEIQSHAGKRDFVQVSIAQRCLEPVGRRRYWPIYRAVADCGLPLGIHTGGFNGHAPVPGSGWCTFLAEQHHLTQINMQSLVTSLVMEGVLEEFPNLKVAIYEGGFVWVPALCWRLDNLWSRLRSEVPQVKRPPSEYIREHFWFSTQPMDEVEDPRQLRQIFEWIGWDRILFATDYPHWDFDDPKHAFKIPLSQGERRKVMSDNAYALFRLA